MGVPEFSSSLTDFNQQQLDTIEAATQAVLSAVNAIKDTDIAALNTKVGANNNSPGTSTLFARLAQVAGFTDTLETLVGLNTATAGTATLFARLAQIAGILQAVPTTLHASYLALPTYTAGQWYTVTNVTGAGVLYDAVARDTGSSAGAMQLRITIDGVAGDYSPAGQLEMVGLYANGAIGFSAVNLPFDSSLKVEMRNPSSTASMYGRANYGLL